MQRLIILLSRVFIAVLLLCSTCQSSFAVGIVSPPVVGAFISSAFGSRVHPTTGAADYHVGVDYAVPMNTPVKPIAAGLVNRASWKGLMGNTVEIIHPNGDLSMYGHLNKISVRVGQNVTHMTTIGLVGSTGRSTGPHLHLTIKRGARYLDPIAYFGNPLNAKGMAVATRNQRSSDRSLLAKSTTHPSKLIASVAKVKPVAKPSIAEIASAKSSYEKLAKEADTFKQLYEEGAISRNYAQEKQLAASNALKHWESLKS